MVISGTWNSTKAAVRTACAVAALLSISVVNAAEVEGYKFPERVQLDGTELVLNGAGVRIYSAFRVYVAALYLPTRKGDGEAILRENQPSRVSLHFLRELTPEQITTSINDALRDTLTTEQRAPLERRLKDFGSILETLPVLKKGARIVIDYVPKAGTTIRVNGETKGSILGADFNQALLRTWIGERPKDTRLKAAMLGVPL
jgi:long-chain acyl-CoA synthetase